jgi:oligosaccharide repeat unit polymerase
MSIATVTLGLFGISFATAIFWNARNKRRVITPSSALLSCYLVSAIGGVYLARVTGARISPLPSLALGLGLFLFLQPVIAVDERRFSSLADPDQRKITQLSVALIIGGLLAILRFAAVMQSALSGDLDANRTAIISGQGLFDTQGQATGSSILTSAAVLAAYAFPVMLNLAFYHLTTGKSKIIAALLFFASCSYVVYVTGNVGRDGFVLWTGAFAFNCIVFWKSISIRMRWLLVATAGSTLGIFAVVFAAITSQRFSGREYSELYYQVTYFGSTIANFTELVELNLRLGFGELNFPLIYRVAGILGIRSYNPYAGQDWVAYCLAQNYIPTIFSTFLGSLVVDFGILGMLGCALVFNIAARFIFRPTSNHPTISLLILYLFLVQLLFEGVFYLVRYTVSGNASIVLVLLVCLWLRKPGLGRRQHTGRTLLRPGSGRERRTRVVSG